MTPDPAAVVLAGGVGSRMGGSKAVVELAGKPLIRHVLDAVIEAGLSPLVVAKPDTELPELGCPVAHEPAVPRHPLLGVVEGISGRGNPDFDEPAVVMPCDMPFLPPELLTWLAAQPEPLVVCEGAGRLHPLLGRYAPSLINGLMAAVDAGAPAQETVLQLGARVVSEADLSNFGPPARVLFNVNDSSDLAQAERMAAK